MSEDFLHFIWKFRLFETLPLKTVTNQSITIFKTGFHNTNAGPDFLNAKVKIGSETWVGNVEIHLRSSDWNAHNHQNDEAYKNVILHVVFHDDCEIQLNSKGDLPVLDLSKYISLRYINNYESLLKSRDSIPCASNFQFVDEFIWNNWLDRLVVERLERKTQVIQDQLKNLQSDWNEVFYRMLAQNFGFKVNAEPFLQLAESLPSKILNKHSDSEFQIEALLFGQAGFLENDFEGKYPNALKNEYVFLKNKYNLYPLKKSTWKFLRLMPNSFPPIRISQFAKLLFHEKYIFSKLLEMKDVSDVLKLFSAESNEYWKNHSSFDKKSKKSVKRIGKKSQENILINTIIPFLFLYGKTKNKQIYIDRALNFLEKCKPENNNITRKWNNLLGDKINENLKINNALQSQACLELKNEYCLKKKCLSCSIGINILKN